MAEIMTESGTTHQETRIYVFRGVQVHRRKDAQGQFTLLDAIDEDEKTIRQIADRLQRKRRSATSTGSRRNTAKSPSASRSRFSLWWVTSRLRTESQNCMPMWCLVGLMGRPGEGICLRPASGRRSRSCSSSPPSICTRNTIPKVAWP